MAAKPAPPCLSDDQLFDWLRLVRSENVGPRTFRALIDRYGGARAALEALPELARRGGAQRPVRLATAEEVERELAIALKLGVRFVAIGEPDYPPLLGEIDSAPPLLACRGRIEALRQPTAAIVGSRNASAAGLTFAERLARGLGRAGYVVASGLARGIDQRAHAASLETGAVGVLAGGHAKPYPSEAVPLIERMVEHGAVVSEMPIEQEPRGRDFPRRNRIVSGLALGTIVVEAARGSGSLITARFALEQNRQVFAVPGSPLDPRLSFDTFVVGRSSSLAHRAAKQVATAIRDNPVMFNPLYVHAQVGLGKTHLLQAITWAGNAAERRMLYLTAERFVFGFVSSLRTQTTLAFKELLRSTDVLLIDDLQFLQGKSTHAEFSHTLNAMIDAGRQVVVAADRPPLDLENLDERVRSRLAGGLVVEMSALGEELRLEILQRWAAAASVHHPEFDVPASVLSYIAKSASAATSVSTDVRVMSEERPQNVDR